MLEKGRSPYFFVLSNRAERTIERVGKGEEEMVRGMKIPGKIEKNAAPISENRDKATITFKPG